MTKKEMEDALKRAIVSGLRLEGVKPEELDADTPLFGDAGLMLDSLDAVELVVIVEKDFGVSIASAGEAHEAFASVSRLADFILAHSPQPGAEQTHEA